MSTHESPPGPTDDETSEAFRPRRGVITPLPADEGEGTFGEQHLFDEDDAEHTGDDELRDRQSGQDQRD